MWKKNERLESAMARGFSLRKTKFYFGTSGNPENPARVIKKPFTVMKLLTRVNTVGRSRRALCARARAHRRGDHIARSRVVHQRCTSCVRVWTSTRVTHAHAHDGQGFCLKKMFSKIKKGTHLNTKKF